MMWEVLVQPFADFGFMRRALMGCIAISVGATPVGVFLMLRRMSLTGDAMAHAILPGAAVGYLVAGLSLGAMTVGGLIAGMAVALLAGFVTRVTALREDASLAAFYLISLAVGVLIVSTRGSNVDLMHVLFGTVLALDDAALILLCSIASLSIFALAALFRPLVLECADPQFLRSVSGLSAMTHFTFLALVVLNLVAGFHALGTLMAVGIMILPRRRRAVLGSRHRPTDRRRHLGCDALEPERPSSLLPCQPAVRAGDHSLSRVSPTRCRWSSDRWAASPRGPSRAAISKPEKEFQCLPARALVISATAGLALSLAAPAIAQSDGPIPVVATFSILGDMVKRIGGEHVAVMTLVGPDGDAHVYQPTPADARAVSEAKILVVNGLQFEGWMDRLIDASDFDGMRVVATEGIEPIAFDDRARRRNTGSRRRGRRSRRRSRP